MMINQDEGITTEEAVEIYEAGEPYTPSKGTPSYEEIKRDAYNQLRSAGYAVTTAEGENLRATGDSPDHKEVKRRAFEQLRSIGLDPEDEDNPAPKKRASKQSAHDKAADRIAALDEPTPEAPGETAPPTQIQPPPQQPVTTAAQLTNLRAAIEAKASEVDWHRLRMTDPGEFAAQRQEYLEAKAWVDMQERALSANTQQQHAAAQAQMQSQMAQYVQRAEQQLLTMIPSWSDPGVRQKEAIQVAAYLKKTGYTDRDISNLYDPRTVAIAYKAMKAEQRPKPKRPPRRNEDDDLALEMKRRNLRPHSVEAGALRLERLWNS